MIEPIIEYKKDGWLAIRYDGDFSVFRTFDCGQCFRFNAVENSMFDNEVEGIAFGRKVNFADNGDFLMVKSTEKDFNLIWKDYLGLSDDYGEINSSILNANLGHGTEHMKKAYEVSKGIRILKQEKWEALCSFIISQNNNIPRIKKIIENMCEKYGKPALGGGFSFPSPEALVDAGENAIFNLKTGFRAKYIYDAACKVSSGDIDFNEITNSKDYASAEKILLSINGVGPKVAACTLLFGFYRLDAFPIDVWIKRVIEKRFPDGLDIEKLGKYAGVAQQYLFYCERYIG